jgi:16S rRNA (guanine966-N2)-methyltransferase
MSEFRDLAGVHVLDLYAGSGALGLEALSRGAASVLLVESDARAAAVVKANVKAMGLAGATVATDRVERLLARPPAGRRPADLVFADPRGRGQGAHSAWRRLARRWGAGCGRARHQIGGL